MGKQVRLPEDFVKMLRTTYSGGNDMERLKNWKRDSVKPEIERLIRKIEEIDVNNSSTGGGWTRAEISDVAEDVVYSLMKDQ